MVYDKRGMWDQSQVGWAWGDIYPLLSIIKIRVWGVKYGENGYDGDKVICGDDITRIRILLEEAE